MTVIVIAVLALIWIAVLVRWRDGTRRAELSIEHQRRAFEAMEGASGRARSPRRRARRATPAGAGTPPADRAPDGPPVAAPAGAPRRRSPALLAVPLAATVALGAFLVIWQLGGRGTSAPGSPGAARVPAGAASSVPRHRATEGRRVRPAPAPGPTTPTTVAPPPVTSLGPDTSGTVAFAVARPGFQVTITAQDACWLQVRDAPDGPVVFEATLPTGGTQTFSGDQALWLRLGAPGHATITVDGQALTIGGPPLTPVDVSLTAATTP